MALVLHNLTMYTTPLKHIDLSWGLFATCGLAMSVMLHNGIGEEDLVGLWGSLVIRVRS